MDVLFSDPSDGNTNSALLSDDTDDVSRAVKNQEFDAKVTNFFSLSFSDLLLHHIFLIKFSFYVSKNPSSFYTGSLFTTFLMQWNNMFLSIVGSS